MENLRFNELSRLHLVGLVLGAMIALALMVAPSGSQAAEEPFAIVFDEDQVKIGLIEELPVEATTSGGSIEGTVDENGNVTIPPEGFKFPLYGLSEPVSIAAYMTTSEPATGTWNEETGQLVLDAETGIFLKVNVGQVLGALEGLGIDLGSSLGPLALLLNGDLACGFSPMDVTFSTEAEGGARFTKGTLGPGALVAEWSQLGSFAGQAGVGLSGFACPLIKSYAPTLLEGLVGGALPGGLDLGGLDIASLLDNLDALDLGPSSLALTRTLDENPPVVDPPEVLEPKLKLTVNPKQRKVQAGKSAVFTVKVNNSGNGTANGVKVCLKSPGPKVVKAKRCGFLGKVGPGATRTHRFNVKIKKGKVKSAKVSFELQASNAVRARAASRLLIRR